MKEKCSGYDYSLVETARQELLLKNAVARKSGAPINKFICVCIHCHGAAVKENEIKHSSECCLVGQRPKKTEQLKTALELFDASLKEVQDLREKRDWEMLLEATKNLERFAFRIYAVTKTSEQETVINVVNRKWAKKPNPS